MNRTRSSFLNKKNLIATALGLSIIGTLAATNMAHAQTSTTLPGVTTSTPSTMPLPAPVGVTATGWNGSSIIAQGYTVGGDGKGLTTTVADGVFRLGVDANLATNLQGSCTVDCQYTLSKVSLVGEQISGARSVNQGIGTLNAPVASIAGTNGMFTSSAQIKWLYTPPPAAPTGN